MMSFAANLVWNIYATLVAKLLARLLVTAAKLGHIDPTATREEWLRLCDQAWRGTQ